MKLRANKNLNSGAFNLSQLIDTIKVSDTSSRKHLNNLIQYGYVKQVSPKQYKIVSFKKLVGDNLHEKFYKISDEELNNYTWRNISYFRALLVELANQKNRNNRKSLRRGYNTKTRDGVIEKIKIQSRKEFDTLLSTTYVSTYTGKHHSTISNYRRKQKLVKYSTEKPITVKAEKASQKSEPMIFTADLVFKKEGQTVIKYGKYFTFNGNLLFFPISKRFGAVKINGY